MPYIWKPAKEMVDYWLKNSNNLDEFVERLVQMTGGGSEQSGVIVYVIFKILRRVYGGGDFEVRSNALKVLESAKLEYYRRVMMAYEDEKIAENGDVK